MNRAWSHRQRLDHFERLLWMNSTRLSRAGFASDWSHEIRTTTLPLFRVTTSGKHCP
jgi:hypothetical protein